MKIREITGQNRRDFRAVYECEHCGSTEGGPGYDDRNFHENVIPAMVCSTCGETAPETYRPLATKYEDSEVI